MAGAATAAAQARAAARTEHGSCSALCKQAASTVPLGHSQGIGPLALFHFFQFSEYVQILAKFKNLCRILLNSESCETNFVG
jgi:hypothetical protein